MRWTTRVFQEIRFSIRISIMSFLTGPIMARVALTMVAGVLGLAALTGGVVGTAYGYATGRNMIQCGAIGATAGVTTLFVGPPVYRFVDELGNRVAGKGRHHYRNYRVSDQ
jgi:hypothetical protein